MDPSTEQLTYSFSQLDFILARVNFEKTTLEKFGRTTQPKALQKALITILDGVIQCLRLEDVAKYLLND